MVCPISSSSGRPLTAIPVREFAWAQAGSSHESTENNPRERVLVSEVTGFTVAKRNLVGLKKLDLKKARAGTGHPERVS